MSFLNVHQKIVVSLFAMLLLLTTARAQDYPIFKWNETTVEWEKESTGGAAVRISVGPDGSPWVVNSAGKIFHLSHGSWRLLPGSATDIGVGADGSVWVIGGNRSPLENGSIFKLDSDGQAWSQVAGGAVNVSVSNSGAPWVVNAAGGIFRWVDGGFRDLPGEATDIGVGGEFDSAWVTGARTSGIYYLSRAGAWVQVPGGAFRISVGPDGKPWVVTGQKTIYRWANDKFELMPGRATDVGVGADGSVWVIGYSTRAGSSSVDQSNRTAIPDITPGAPKDTPVRGAKQEVLICRASGDPRAFNIQRSSGSKPGYTKYVIDFAYMNGAPGDKMEPGTCLFENRNYQQNDANRQDAPSRLIEEIPDDTDPMAADFLRKRSGVFYWKFIVYHYVTSRGEHYFKVESSEEGWPSVKLDNNP